MDIPNLDKGGPLLHLTGVGGRPLAISPHDIGSFAKEENLADSTSHAQVKTLLYVRDAKDSEKFRTPVLVTDTVQSIITRMYHLGFPLLHEPSKTIGSNTALDHYITQEGVKAGSLEALDFGLPDRTKKFINSEGPVDDVRSLWDKTVDIFHLRLHPTHPDAPGKVPRPVPNLKQ